MARHSAPCAAVMLAAAVAVLLLLATTASAYPFGKGAAVTEVTPASFNDFVNSHKPVVLLFYAPWCGHCKSFEPEFIRFAESVKGTVRVGAINADTHASFGQQYGVRGFPTIKFWKAGKKSVSAPQEYQGPRTAPALQQLVTGDIPEDRVTSNLASVAALESAVRGAPLKRVAALFSRKTKVPAMFSVLSLSRQLQSLPFVFLGGEAEAPVAIREALGVADVPAVALIAWNETTQSLQVVPYPKKKMLYDPIAKFFVGCLSTSEEAPLCGTGGADAEAAAQAKGGSTQQLHDEDDIDMAASFASSQKRAPVRFATPVGPVEFSPERFAAHCSPTSAKVAGAAPVCVLLTTPKATEEVLATLYGTFAHDPVVVLFANTAESRQAVAEYLAMTAQLPLDVPDEARTEAIAYRHARAGVIRYKRLASVDTLADDLSRILSGDMRLDTQQVA